MSGFFFIITVVIVLAVLLPALIKSRSNRDCSRIINADWMDSHDKFHLISRWGA